MVFVDFIKAFIESLIAPSKQFLVCFDFRHEVDNKCQPGHTSIVYSKGQQPCALRNLETSMNAHT